MKIDSLVLIAAFTLASAGGWVHAQDQPAPAGGSSASLSTTARDALSSVKAARASIGKKDYTAAKTDIGNAQADLKAFQANPKVGELEGIIGSRTGGTSPLSQAQKHLNGAQSALAHNQPQAADSLLGKAEGVLKSII